MAGYDRTTDTIVLRIVYDGLGGVGKTTNIQQIWEQFSIARRSDVLSPEVHRGRTLYFDWIEIDAGRIHGRRLRCQVLTVPGQLSYAQRRWDILRNADAVVAVCDSDPSALRRMKLGLRFLRRTLAAEGKPDLPVVFQANRQDVPGALSPEALAEALGVVPPSVIIGATASAGEGVRRTLLAAIHEVAAHTRARIAAAGVEALGDVPEAAEALFDRLKALEDGPPLDEGARLADEVIDDVEAADGET